MVAWSIVERANKRLLKWCVRADATGNQQGANARRLLRLILATVLTLHAGVSSYNRPMGRLICLQRADFVIHAMLLSLAYDNIVVVQRKETVKLHRGRAVHICIYNTGAVTERLGWQTRPCEHAETRPRPVDVARFIKSGWCMTTRYSLVFGAFLIWPCECGRQAPWRSAWAGTAWRCARMRARGRRRWT